MIRIRALDFNLGFLCTLIPSSNSAFIRFRGELNCFYFFRIYHKLEIDKENGEGVEKLHSIDFEAGELGDWDGGASHDSILRMDD